jgi:hypothetical protein
MPYMNGFHQYVVSCREEAARCGRMAENASTDQLRADYLRCQSSWLHLAKAYEKANDVLFNTEANRVAGKGGAR